LHDGVFHQVAEEEVAAGANPHRALDELEAAMHLFDFGVGWNDGVERAIDPANATTFLCLCPTQGDGEQRTDSYQSTCAHGYYFVVAVAGAVFSLIGCTSAPLPATSHAAKRTHFFPVASK